jgi:hypothetical protein
MLRLAADENFNNDIVRRNIPLGQAIEDIILIAECSVEGEWEGQVRYLPLR